MNPAATIRPARQDDAAAIARIYAHHVLHGTASFEVEPPGAGEIARRLAEVESRHLPYLILEHERAIAGYAYATLYRPRTAYRFTVEDSVYLDPARLGRGFGKMLLTRLIEECRGRGFRQMIAVIGDSANTPSIRLHERCGFAHAGVLRGVGFKFGRWIDTVLMQRALD